MRLDFGPLLMGIKNSELIQMLQAIEHWSLGNVDDRNIKEESLTGSYVLKDHSVPLVKLTWLEIPIPLFKVLPAASAAAAVDGGYFYYDPVRFPGGSWYLEALLKATSPATATVKLMSGTLELASVSTANTSWTLVRGQTAVSMPTSAGALTCKLLSSDGTTTVYALGASLIFVPA